MSKVEFLRELQAALSGLPSEERQAAVKYYEEYFEEAGSEREPEILAELGSPGEIAESLLRDYSSVPVTPDKVEYETPPGQDPTAGQTAGQTAEPGREARYQAYKDEWSRWKNCLPAWVWIVILCCAAPVLLALLSAVIGIITGLLGGALGLLGGLVGLAAGLVAIVFGVVVVVFTLMFAAGLAGIALVVGGFSSIVAGCIGLVVRPAWSILAIGVGALCMGIGLLLAILGFWMGVHLLPKVIRLTVGAIGTVINKIRELMKRGVKKV